MLTPGDATERIYGLGQGNWTAEGGCPSGPQRVVPLERNGQTVNLQQRKFHVSIPFVTSTAGYGFLFNMPGYGEVQIGAHGVGGGGVRRPVRLHDDVLRRLPRRGPRRRRRRRQPPAQIMQHRKTRGRARGPRPLPASHSATYGLSLIHISDPTRRYANS